VNKTGFIIFISVALVIYLSVNSYIFIRGLQAIPVEKFYRTPLIIVFWLLVLAYPLGRILIAYDFSSLGSVVIYIGSLWLGYMVYLLLSVFFLDILRTVNHFVPLFPEVIRHNYTQSKLIAFYAVNLIVFITVVFGFINAKYPVIKNVQVSVNKANASGKTLNIVAVSDIHLGTIISNSRVSRMVNLINSQNPDIVLLAGDVIDEDVAPVIKNNLGAELTKIKARYGVYAITGNHEYIGGVEPAAKYLSEHGINMLRDTAVLIDNSFYVIGREDLSKRSVNGGRGRKSLAELSAPLDKTKPVIMLDHQPFHLEDAENNGIDLQISGHTHHGQLWPFGLITNKVYEVSWGYKKRGNTNYYVSCGAGTWGPPIRTGNRPEIVNIKINFNGTTEK